MLEQKRRDPRRWFRNLRMSFRIMLSVGVLIFCSNLLMLILVCTSATRSVRLQTEHQVENQLTMTLSNVSGVIADLGELMITMTTTTDIANFANADFQSRTDHLEILNGVNEELRILKRTNTMIDYVALLRVDNKHPLYVGREMMNRQVYEKILENAQEAQSLALNGITMNIFSGLYTEAELNLYCPVFEKYTLNMEPTAYLVVGLNATKLIDAFCSGSSAQTIRILSQEGLILLAEDTSTLGQQIVMDERYEKDADGFLSDDSEVMYQKFGKNNLMVEISIPRKEWSAMISQTAKMLAIAILAFTMLALLIIYRLCCYFYEPMNEMLETMRKVGEGDLDQRMKNYEQQDFGQIASTFNSMTESLKNQMEMVRKKEQENTQIRLNSLQSQIKPHFLYNTLECIHWQALLEGANEASRMVMALSRYYRLSLSKGAEFVTFEKELEHTMSYIMIQNIRFDDILEMEYEIDEAVNQMEIPKITLQPLIENAIYHGIKPMEDKKGHVKICAKLEGDWMVIRVMDDGIGMTDEQLKHLNENIDVLINDGSYGVKNVHTRLEIRYGKGSGLHYEKNETGGITVTVRLPARKAD